MRVVSNTSPLSNLAIIGRLDLLKQRYGVVRIPPAVAAELSRLSHVAGKARITAALTEGWLIVENPPANLPTLTVPLDPGEHEAIALALATRADVLLIDEKRGRAAARQAGLVVAGGGRCVGRITPRQVGRKTSGDQTGTSAPSQRGGILR